MYNIKKVNLPVIFGAIGIYLFPFILRNTFWKSISNINFLVYIGLIYGYIHKIFCFPFSTNKKYFFISLLILIEICASTFLLFYVHGNGWSIIWKFKMIFVYILPVLFVYLNIRNGEQIKNFCDIWIKWLRFACWLMCIFWFLDILLNNAIQNALSILYRSKTLVYMISQGRFVSFYGHSLESAFIFILLMIWTNIKKNHDKGKSNNLYLIDVFVSLFGIAITGSKSGLILAIILLLMCNLGLKKTKYMLGILLVFAILYFSGAMNIVINRILEGVAVGDLSTSRNTALERLLANGEISFKPLSGHVINYNYSSMISALEYPFLRWAYTNGIVFSAVMYFMYFIVPGLRVLRTKNWNELICVLILMAFVNGNNGISAYNDDLLIYSINIGLILQYISYEKRWTIWGKIK